MKDVTMFYFPTCPYCRQAIAWTEELQKQYPELASVKINMIDEKKHPEIADTYDYWNVPTYYVDGKKLHEGAATKANIEKVLRAAL